MTVAIDDLSSAPLEPAAPRLWSAVEVTVSGPAAEEQARRQAAVDFARGSVRWEGFHLSPEVEAINNRFIRGETGSDEHMTEIRSVCGLS